MALPNLTRNANVVLVGKVRAAVELYHDERPTGNTFPAWAGNRTEYNAKVQQLTELLVNPRARSSTPTTQRKDSSQASALAASQASDSGFTPNTSTEPEPEPSTSSGTVARLTPSTSSNLQPSTAGSGTESGPSQAPENSRVPEDTMPFTEDQLQQISQIVSQSVTAALAQIPASNNGAPGPVGPQGPQGPPGPAGAGSSSVKFTPETIGFFDPHLPTTYGTGDLVNIGKDLFIRDVYVFTDKIRDAAAQFGEEIVRTNLSSCLRGYAQQWYSGEIDEFKRAGLRTMPDGLDRWINELQGRFKKSMTEAQKELISQRYTVKDAMNRREPGEYVQSMVRSARNAGLKEVQQQLVWAWNGIEGPLQAVLDEPDENTTVAEFIKQMNSKKNSWASSLTHNPRFGQSYTQYNTQFNARRPIPPYLPQPYAPPGFQGPPGYAAHGGYYGGGLPQNPFPYRSNFPQNQAQGTQNNPYAGRQPPTRPQLQITANQSHTSPYRPTTRQNSNTRDGQFN
jgi:hypothetical protein